jgi:hypothetical protein
MTDMRLSDRPLAFVSAFGILGGAALIAVNALTRRGPAILVVYAAIVAVCGWVLRTERVHSFRRRFALHLGTFMAATVVLYLFVAQFSAHSLLRIPVLGHAWRIGALLGIGAVLSLATAYLTKTTDAP